MRRLYIIVFLHTLILSTFLIEECVGQKFCGQIEKEQNLYSTNKELLERSIDIEKKYAVQIKKPKNGFRSGIITLPIVVHIIHDNGVENISDARVFQAIENLNAAFKNQNYYNPETGLDTEIEFCLAKRDTANNAINGIVRHESALTDMSIHFSNSLISEISAFNPDEYINIRILRNLCIGADCASYSGYAVNALNGEQQFRNGIVIQHDYFGVSPQKDVVLVHEMGHFLGLLHTFHGGCKNDNCLKEGDRVCDTPPDNSTTNIACIASANSCYTDEDDSSQDNPFRPLTLGGLGDQNDSHQNYMDYGILDCMNQFTQGQSDRMRWFIKNIYSPLLDSKACLLPCQNDVEANFIANSTDYHVMNLGESVLFTGVPLNSDSSYWIINCVDTFYNSSLLFDPNETGIFNIKYIAVSADEGCNNDLSDFFVDVTCPVLPDFVFTVSENQISFTNTSTNINSFYWEVFDGPTVIHTSLLESETIEISSPGLYNLCLTVSNNLCQETYCQFFDIYGNGIEICDNELDDDNDGLVDLFDSDCLCDEDSYHGQCFVECQNVPDSFPSIEPRLKWVSEVLNTNFWSIPNFVIGDFIKGNENNEIIILSDKRDFFTNTGEIFISALNSENGQIIQEKLFDRSLSFQLLSDGAIGDVNRDGLPELFMHTGDSLYIFDGDFSIQENKDISIINSLSGSSINLADFNGDGLSEVYINSSIFNHKGDLLVKNEEGGCNYIGINGCISSHTIAADLLDSPGLELAVGNVVYDIEINNTNDTLGNISTKTYAAEEVGDGYTTVGDIDGDGFLDVIVVSGLEYTKNGVWVWNPRTGQKIAKGTVEQGGGGVPFIGDIDGDCRPEIGVTFNNVLKMYKYNGTQNLQSLYSINTSDNTGRTGITMFDFNQDGLMELLYQDETDFKILDGSTGNTLFSYPVFSATLVEYPIVADVDNDGEAEILVSGGISSKDSIRIFCFETNSFPWTPARAVWNQYGYHVTNVNDDLTIPKHPQNGAIDLVGTEICLRDSCSTPYNNFLVQATTRTQEGCLIWPAIDLTIDILEYECTPDSNCFNVSVTNSGSKKMSSDSVTIYWGLGTSGSTENYSSSQTTIYFQKNSEGIIFDNSDTVTICVSRDLDDPNNANSLYMLFGVNDAGLGPNTPFDNGREIYECDYENNYDSTPLIPTLPPIELGQDIVKCRGEVVTFNLSGYDSYLWNGLSTDSIFSTSSEGLHYIEAYDICGASYRDTILITFDTINEINLETKISLCPNEPQEITVDENFDNLQWFPKDAINCDDCSTIEILSDTSLYIYVVAKKDNCISTDSIFVDILEEVILNDTIPICAQDQYIFQDSVLTAPGTYEFKINNCDSIQMITIVESPLDSVPFLQSICRGDSVFFDNIWIYESGTYFQYNLNEVGCDSISMLELQVYDEILNTDTIEICNGDTIQVFNYMVYSDSIITELFISDFGCDSLHTVYVFENDILSRNIYEKICFGDSIKIGDTWYNDEGNFSYIKNNPEECDSIINVEIEIKDEISVFDTIQSCHGDTISIFGFLVFESLDIEQTFTTEEECDSTILVHVEVMNAIDTLFDYEICQGDSIEIGNNIFKETGEYEIPLIASNGCDSTIYLDLMVFDIKNTVEDILICKDDSIQLYGQYYSQPETLIFTEMSKDGCDSVITINIDTTASFIDNISILFCEGDSILIDSNYINEQGEYLSEYVSVSGCDSTIIFRLEFIQVNEGFVEYTICEGDSIQVEEVWLYDEGINEIETTTSLGCDSTIQVLIHHTLPQYSMVDTFFCEGDSLFIDNEWISADTSLEIQLESIEGCDSIITVLILGLFPEVYKDTTIICEGDSIFHDGVWVKDNQIFLDTIYTGDCFEVFYDYYILNEAIITQESHEICIGDTLYVHGLSIFEEGTYEVNLPSEFNCDSIILFSVSTIFEPSFPKLYFDCEENVQIAELTESSNWGIYWSNGDTSPITQYTASGSEYLILTNTDGCRIEYLFEIEIPKEVDFDSLPKDTTILEGGTVFYNLEIETSNWNLKWYPSEIIDCDSCSSTGIVANEDREVTIEFVNNYGCFLEHRFNILVSLRPQLLIPNVFSPNGDNLNDNWVIRFSNYNINETRIFDRWGNMVQHWQNQTEIIWDGTSQERELADGVYVYVTTYLDDNGNSVQIIGDVTLIR